MESFEGLQEPVKYIFLDVEKMKTELGYYRVLNK